MTRILAAIVSRLNRRLQARLEAQHYREMVRRFPPGARVRVSSPCAFCAKYRGEVGVIDGISIDVNDYRVKFDRAPRDEFDSCISYFNPDELELVRKDGT